MKRLFFAALSLGLVVSLALPAAALEVSDARELLDTYYIDGLPEESQSASTLDELIQIIGDPYTTYLSKEDYDQLFTSVNGRSICGIGVTIQNEFDDGYHITSILPDSPAMEAGLSAGDVILAVDGIPLSADTDPKELIQGQEGSKVSLTIRRQDSGHVSIVTLTRQEILIPIVTHSMVDSALVITCDSFGQSTPNAVSAALTEYEAEAAVCIMDLRDNPGGTSGSAAGTVGLFVGEGAACYFRDAAGRYTAINPSSDYQDKTDKPLIVLTSTYSASGSELFAAAIRDRSAGISIGQRTFGKGVAQSILDKDSYPEFFDGDGLKITTHRFFSPDGATNDTIGVLPTLVISPQNTPAVALMLSGAEPNAADSTSWLKLELAGQTFYLDVDHALMDNGPAFCELLEALPPSATLYKSNWPKEGWEQVSPDQIADEYGLTRGAQYIPRAFSDCGVSPYVEEIQTLAAYQLLSGDGNHNFFPNRTITRAEFCAMTAAALNLFPSKTTSFSDVSPDAWYAGAVSAMYGKGFISGDENGAFRPDSTITYQEIVSILNKVASWACMDGYRYDQIELEDALSDFYQDYSLWARAAARNLDFLGALVDDIPPTSPATRDVAAATLYHLLEGADLLWH